MSLLGVYLVLSLLSLLSSNAIQFGQGGGGLYGTFAERKYPKTANTVHKGEASPLLTPLPPRERRILHVQSYLNRCGMLGRQTASNSDIMEVYMAMMPIYRNVGDVALQEVVIHGLLVLLVDHKKSLFSKDGGIAPPEVSKLVSFCIRKASLYVSYLPSPATEGKRVLRELIDEGVIDLSALRELSIAQLWVIAILVLEFENYQGGSNCIV